MLARYSVISLHTIRIKSANQVQFKLLAVLQEHVPKVNNWVFLFLFALQIQHSKDKIEDFLLGNPG